MVASWLHPTDDGFKSFSHFTMYRDNGIALCNPESLPHQLNGGTAPPGFMCLKDMNDEDYRGGTKRDVQVKAFNIKFGRKDVEINRLTLSLPELGLKRDHQYTFGIRACNHLRGWFEDGGPRDARGEDVTTSTIVIR